MLKRISAEIPDPFVEREEDPVGRVCGINDGRIRRAAKPLLGDSVRIVPQRAKIVHEFGRRFSSSLIFTSP